MTRGRKKDLTKPPARSLVQQRDYRERKARYIAELEERCRKAEEDNAMLREELRKIRAAQGSVGLTDQRNPETVEAAADLFEKLSQASDSLGRFQALASGSFTKPCCDNGNTSTCHGVGARSVLPSDQSSPPSAPHLSAPRFTTEHTSHMAGGSLDVIPTPNSASGECCAGLFDCEGDLELNGTSSNSFPMERWSGLRSTSGQRFHSS